METTIKEFQRQIADILNADEWFGQHDISWLPEDTLNVEYEIKKSLGQTGMVAVVTTPELNYQGEHESIASQKNYEETDGEVSFTVTNLGDPQDTRGLLLVTNPFSNQIDGHKIYFSRWLDGNPLELEWRSENGMYVAIVDDVFNGFIPPIEGSTTWFVVNGMNEFRTDENPFEPDDFSVQWTIQDQQGRTITIQETDESPLPHDPVDYIEWTGLQYFDTGVTVGPNTRIEAKFSNFPTISQTSYPFAVEDTNAQRAIFYQMTASRFGLYLTNASIDFGNASHVNVSLDLKNGGYTFNGTSGSLVGGLGQRTVSTLTIGTLNYNGTPKVEASYIVRPGTRIERFKIFEDDVAVRDLIPVVKNGVPCLFDQVTSQYFYNANTEEQTPMVAGPTVQKTYYKISGGCFGTGYIIVEPNEQTTTISGTSEYTAELALSGDKPLSVSMSKESGGTIGKPYDKEVEWLESDFIDDPPYDAEVEYLEATGTQWISTPLKISSEGRLQVDASFNSWTGTNETLWCARTFSGSNQVDAIALFKLANGTLGWDVRPTGSTSRITVTYAGDSNRHSYKQDAGALYIDGTQVATTTATVTESGGPLYLFVSNYFDGTMTSPASGRLYSVKYWDANGNLVMDLIPVRLNSTGYLYDKVSGQLFENAGTGAFGVGPDTQAYERRSYIDTGINGSSDLNVEVTVAKMPVATTTDNNATIGCSRINGSNRVVALSYLINTQIPRYGYDDSNNTYFKLGEFPLTVGIVDATATLNGVSYKSVMSNNSFSNSVPFTLFAFNSNGSKLGTCKVAISRCKMWISSEQLRDMIPVVAGGEPAFYDKVTEQLFYNQGLAPFTVGPDCTPPTTTDSSAATFTDTVVVVNKGFDATVSLQVVENPTVNRGKPDKDKIATALDIAHRAIYALAGYETDHFNAFSPSTVRQSTVAGSGNKLLQVDARFSATPIL